MASLTAQRCAANIDFEEGHLANWKCDTGRALNAPNFLETSGPVGNRHTVFRNNANIVDPYGNFPLECPNGSGYSLQLGNSSTGAQAEKLTYDFRIPDNQPSYSMVYWYAVVFQNPDHSPFEQPKFLVSVTDRTTGERIDCASFEYVVSRDLPGFTESTVLRNVLYKSWTPVTVNLAGRNGHDIVISFTTVDCTRGGHFGYAYVDIDTDCSGALKGAGYCDDVNEVILEAPYGFKDYRWFTNEFKDFVSDQHKVTLSPVPAVGSKYAVVLTPYSGYGCADTLETVIKRGSIPSFTIPNHTICQGDSVLLSTGFNSTAYSYTWVPTIGIRYPDSFAVYAAPKEDVIYKLKVVDTASGCTKEKNITINILRTNTPIRVKGDTIACGNNTHNVELITVPAPSIQWKLNGIDLTGETNTTIKVTTPGRYSVLLQTPSCSYNSAPVVLRNSPYPVANFSIDDAEQCIINNSFKVTAGYAGILPVSRVWTWGDNFASLDSIAVHQYLTAGRFNIQLKTTTRDGCVDTISKSVLLYDIPAPDFTVSNICEKSNTIFTNTTPEILGSQLSYSWHLGNANILYSTTNAQTSYETPGSYIISLRATSNNCGIPIEIQKRINIAAKPKALKKTVNTVFGLPTILSTLNKGNQYKWTPAINLNDDTIATPTFTSNAANAYLVTIGNEQGCFVTDTVDVKLFKDITILVPTAFTPNGDGKNDRLHPILIGTDVLQYFRIWNRWGNLVYETNSPSQGWDGTVKGVKQSVGTYVWEALAVGAGGIPVRRNGLVTIL